MTLVNLPHAAQLKPDLMFHGIRYTEALGKAAEHGFPNFYPHRFQTGEHDPRQSGKATIPYALYLGDGAGI